MSTVAAFLEHLPHLFVGVLLGIATLVLLEPVKPENEP